MKIVTEFKKEIKMSNEDNNMFMNDQAVGAVMMALQKSLMEQSDIVPVLKGFKFRLSETGLVVMNPPLVKADVEGNEVLEEDGE
jgi:hypothetical protein